MPALRGSRGRSAAHASGCSMWAKWPTPSSISQRPSCGDVRQHLVGGVPQPISSISHRASRRTARRARPAASAPTRVATARIRRSAATGRSSSASRRRSRSPRSVTRHRSHSCGSRGFIRPRRAASSSIVPGLRLRAGGAAAVVEPAGQLLGEHRGALVFGDVGDVAAWTGCRRCSPATETERLRVGELDHQRAALRVPDGRHRVGRPATWSNTAQRVAEVGVPRVEVCVVAVAVTTMVPADDPPAGVGEHGGERVERPGEVESAVREQQRWGVGIAPLVDGDPHAGRRRSDPSPTSGTGLAVFVETGVVVRRRHRADVVEATAVPSRVYGDGAAANVGISSTACRRVGLTSSAPGAWRCRSSLAGVLAACGTTDEASRRDAATDPDDDHDHYDDHHDDRSNASTR